MSHKLFLMTPVLLGLPHRLQNCQGDASPEMSPVAVCEDLAPDILCHHCPALQIHVDRGDGRALCTLQLLICHALGCGLQS